MATSERTLTLLPNPEADLLSEPLIQQVEIVGIREGYIDCWVPRELIDREEVPVREEWAESLALQMRQVVSSEAKARTGQRMPLQLGLISGEPKLKISDGFHRDAALEINGQELRYATIVPTTWDKLYDDRIFMAKDHRQVRFSRVVQWIRESWQFSGMSDRLSVEQAVLLYRFDGDGSKLHISASDAEQAKGWVAHKEDLWQIAAMTIHGHLKVAATVDPALVHSARDRTGGHILTAPTQAILKIFSNELPSDFDLQKIVMEAAKAHNLRGPQVKALCQGVKGRDAAAAQAFIGGIDWAKWEPQFSESTERQLRRQHDVRYKGAAVFAKTIQEIGRVAQRISQSFEREEEVTPDMQVKIEEAKEQVNGLLTGLGELTLRLDALTAHSKTAPAEKPNTVAAAALDEPKKAPVVTVAPKRSAKATKPATSEAVPVARRQPARVLSLPPGIHITTEQEEHHGSEAFKAGLKDYLDERAEDPPAIRSRRQVLWAEQLLREGTFSGDLERREIIHQDIKEAREGLKGLDGPVRLQRLRPGRIGNWPV